MDELQGNIIMAMEDWSSKGKTKVSPNDLSKKVGVSQRALKDGVRPLMERSALNYWHSGSMTYIMLQANFEKLKVTEEA